MYKNTTELGTVFVVSRINNKKKKKTGMAMHVCDPSNWEAEEEDTSLVPV
jgi:hypothetical protein